MLSKLYIPDNVDDDKARTLKLLVNNVKSRRPPPDTASKNNLKRFDALLDKKFEAQLADLNEEELRKMENLQELFEFLDDIIPEDEDEEEPVKKRATKKR